MHRRASKAITWLSVAACSVAMAACGTSSDSGDAAGEESAASNGTDDAIVIGASIPLSGASGATGEKERQGMELALKEINDAGGVKGRQLELMVEDDESNPTTAIALVDKFDQAGAVAIVGPYNSPVVLGMAEAVATAEIPLLTVAISSAIADLGNRYIFQVNISDREQFRRIAQEIAGEGHEKVAVLADSTALGDAGVPIAEQVFPEEGLEIVSVERFDIEGVDHSAQVFRAKEAGAEAIFVYTVGPATGTVMKGVRQAGFEGPVWASGAASDPAVVKAGGDAVDGLRFADFADPTKPEYEAFAEKFEAEYGEGQINNFAPAGYDMVYAVAEALESAQSATAADLVTALEQYSSDSRVTGSEGSTYEFGPEQREALGSSAVVVKEYRDGEVVLAE